MKQRFDATNDAYIHRLLQKRTTALSLSGCERQAIAGDQTSRLSRQATKMLPISVALLERLSVESTLSHIDNCVH